MYLAWPAALFAKPSVAAPAATLESTTITTSFHGVSEGWLESGRGAQSPHVPSQVVVQSKANQRRWTEAASEPPVLSIASTPGLVRSEGGGWASQMPVTATDYAATNGMREKPGRLGMFATRR